MFDSFLGFPMSEISKRWQALAAVSIGTFMATLDSSIVNVSLPTISRNFGIDLPVAQWIVLAYLITVAALLLPTGRFVDLVGRARSYGGGLAVFTLGSLLCGMAWSPEALVSARALQAMGAALIMATGAAVLVDTWPPEQRGRVMGLNGMVVSIGLMTGPPLGGLISGTLGWRWIFYVNLPVGSLGVVLSYFALRSIPQVRGKLGSFDIVGAVTLGLFMVALCLGLTFGPRDGWSTPPTLVLIGSAPVLLGLFIWRQATAANPMLKLSLFANRTFSSASAAALLSFTGQFPVFLFLPFYLQGVLGYSEQETGLTIFVVPLLSALMTPWTGRLSDVVGTRVPTVLGMLIGASGYGALMTLGLSASKVHILVPLVALAFGNAAFGPANQSALMGAVPSAHRGVASSIASAMRSLGMVIGAASGTAIAAARAVSVNSIHGNAILDAMQNPVAFVQGYHASLAFSMVCALGAMVVAGVRPKLAVEPTTDSEPVLESIPSKSGDAS
ncbi:MAG: MFS transporter [Candidatus Zipacnadales bacterium]